jgi:hypothetical protein
MDRTKESTIVMAKKKASLAQPSFPELSAVAKIPDGYYSGDKPNPNLRRFVEEKATPYDPEDDRILEQVSAERKAARWRELPE